MVSLFHSSTTQPREREKNTVTSLKPRLFLSFSLPFANEEKNGCVFLLGENEREDSCARHGFVYTAVAYLKLGMLSLFISLLRKRERHSPSPIWTRLRHISLAAVNCFFRLRREKNIVQARYDESGVADLSPLFSVKQKKLRNSIIFFS